MKTRQITHNDYPAAKYRSRVLDIQRALLYRRCAGCIVGCTQMVSWNHAVANDGTDNDDVDEYASEINRGVRAGFFRRIRYLCATAKTH